MPDKVLAAARPCGKERALAGFLKLGRVHRREPDAALSADGRTARRPSAKGTSGFKKALVLCPPQRTRLPRLLSGRTQPIRLSKVLLSFP